VLGCFPETGTLFVAPVYSDALRALHRCVQDSLMNFAAEISPYYRPDRWQPHCTLAINADPQRLSQWLAALARDFAPRQGWAVEAGAVEVLSVQGAPVQTRPVASRPVRRP
jgi:hypothetical protein